MAMDAVSDSRVNIFPPRYAKSYLDWLREKRDWPVSRQLWWGHRIPVWSRHFESGQQFNRTQVEVPGADDPLGSLPEMLTEDKDWAAAYTILGMVSG